MIVYNITVKVNHEIEETWLQWQKLEHIPEILATKKFNDHKIFKLLDMDDSDGITYIIQFFSADIKNYEEYINQYATALRKKAAGKWNDKMVSFRTIMQLVH